MAGDKNGVQFFIGHSQRLLRGQPRGAEPFALVISTKTQTTRGVGCEFDVGDWCPVREIENRYAVPRWKKLVPPLSVKTALFIEAKKFLMAFRISEQINQAAQESAAMGDD